MNLRIPSLAYYALVFIFGARSSYAATTSLVETNTFRSIDGDSSGTYLYNNATIKLSDRWSFVPDLLTLLTYKNAGVSNFETTHVYTRLALVQKNIAEFDNWKVSMLYRWTPPTALGAQKSGSFGTATTRVKLAGKWTYFDLTFTEAVNAFLQRKRTQVNVPATTAKGNPIFSNYLDMSAEYHPFEGATLSSYFLLIDQLSFPTTKGNPNSWKHEMWQEHELGYEIRSLSNLYIGTSLFHISNLSSGSDFKFMSKTATVSLKVNKEF